MTNKTVQFATDKRLATLTGHVYLFKQGEPREVPKHIYDAAMREGGIPGNVKLEIEDDRGDEVVDVGTPAEKPPLGMIAEVVRDIIDSGESDKLLESGKVRVDALNNEMNRQDITAEDRDAAHTLIEAGE